MSLFGNRTFRAAKTICELSGWRISNLPLQKLLYLSHLIHLGTRHEPLVEGTFEAWNLGPVEPSLYGKVKAYGDQPIPDVFGVQTYKPGDSEYASIKDVYDQLGGQRPGQLVSITHWEGGAWAKNFEPGVMRIAIPNNDIWMNTVSDSDGKKTEPSSRLILTDASDGEGAPNAPPTKKDDALEAVQKELVAEHDARKEERFIWMVIVGILFDSLIFMQMKTWAGPVCIGIIEIILILALGRKWGMDHIFTLTETLIAKWDGRVGKS